MILLSRAGNELMSQLTEHLTQQGLLRWCDDVEQHAGCRLSLRRD
jgi:hypothetical protein